MGRILEIYACRPPLVAPDDADPVTNEVLVKALRNEQRLVGGFNANSSVAAEVEQELVDVGLLAPSLDDSAERPSIGIGWISNASIAETRKRLEGDGAAILQMVPVEAIEDALDEVEWLESVASSPVRVAIPVLGLTC